MDAETTYFKRNLSFNNAQTFDLPTHTSHSHHHHHRGRRNKVLQRMKKHGQRVSDRLKSAALLVTVGLCVLVLFSSLGSTPSDSTKTNTQSRKPFGKSLENLFAGTSDENDDGQGNRFDRAQSPLKGLKNVVVVAGHSVLRYTENSPDENESWYLEPYMEIQGQAATFVEHIRMRIEAAARDPSAILLFSGGTTKIKAGPMTEAQSYWTVAEKLNWFGHEDVRHRAFTENFARDSFENLLFSLCRFNELTSEYPESVAVVSYQFKKQR